MEWHIAAVLFVIGGALAAFLSGRYRVEVVALAVPVTLAVTGLLTVEEAVAGLSHPATLSVAAMLVLSLGVVKSGIVDLAMRGLGRLGMPPGRQIVALCVFAAFASPFLNNTAVVVILLPVVLALCREHKLSPSRYLIPLSFMTILGGTVTVVGTSTNLVVYGIARERGLEELSMFSVAPLGLIYLAVGGAYLAVASRWLLPTRASGADLDTAYSSRVYAMELHVTADSRADVPGGLDLLERDVLVDAVFRDGAALPRHRRRLLERGDVLLVRGRFDRVLDRARRMGLKAPAAQWEEFHGGVPMAELLVPAGSAYHGQTLDSVRPQGCRIYGVVDHGRPVRRRLGDVRLAVGDIVLVGGTAADLAALADDPNLRPLSHATRRLSRPRDMWIALLTLTAVVLLAGIGAIDIMPAALAGAFVVVALRCVTIDEVYRELDWSVIFMLAGLVPLGTVMEKTGAAALLGSQVTSLCGSSAPWVAVAVFYLATSLLTEVMSNNASAIVLTPVALTTAMQLEMSPYTLLVAVMFGASASFMTPMGYQTNTIVLSPGGYRVADYVRIGLPLNVLTAAVATLTIPWFWPP